MLRANAKRAILEVIDDSYFGLSNFTTQFGDGNPLWLEIIFIPNSDFRLLIECIDRSKTPNNLAIIAGLFGYQTSAAPGKEFIKPDIRMCKTFEECAALIPEWIERIKEEVIDSSPINREIQNIRKQLEERIDSLAEQQDEFFSREEAEEVIAKLNRLSSQLADLMATNEDLQKSVEVMQAKIAELGEASETVNKATWYRMAGSRLLRIAKTAISSKEGREFTLEAAKKVLLEGSR